MKTNTRVRRNSVTKPASPQVPNKPEPAIPANTDSAVAALPQAEPMKRVNLLALDRPDMEEAVALTLGLLDLFSRLDSALTLDKGPQAYQGMGSRMWSERLGKALYQDWNSAMESRKSADDNLSVRRLGLTIEKAKALLMALAHDLSGGGECDAYESWRVNRSGSMHLSDLDASPYITMATDCAEYLAASYYVDFQKALPMNQFERDWIETEIVAKFAQTTERKAA